MKLTGRRLLIVTWSTIILITCLMVGVVEDRVPPYLTTIGLAAIGTILGRSAVEGFSYPKIGGLLGGWIATVIEVMIHPSSGVLQPFMFFDNLIIAFVVSVVVAFLIELIRRDREKAI